jgi:hypothetical protein
METYLSTPAVVLSKAARVQTRLLWVCSSGRFSDSLFLTRCTASRNFLVYVVF